MARQKHDIGHRKRLARLAQQGSGQHGGYAVLDHCKRLVARGLASTAILSGAKMGQKWSRENGFTEFRVGGDE